MVILIISEKQKGYLMLAFAAAFSIASFIFSREIAHALGDYGYIGVFLVSAITSASVFLPVPSWALVLGLSGSLNPILLGICAGAGSALGEFTGYYAGMGGKEALTGSGKEMFADHIKWIKGAETGTLFLLAFVPNPFFDVAGIAAGALGIPKWRFFIPVLLGKIARFIILASLGAHMLPPGIN